MALIKYITDIDIEFGAIAKLPEACRAHGIGRPLIVTDAGIKAAGLLQHAVSALGDLPHAVYAETPSNPTEAAVRAATAIATPLPQSMLEPPPKAIRPSHFASL